MSTDDPTFYSVKGAAEVLGMSTGRIYDLLASGALDELRPEQGKTRLVDAASVAAFQQATSDREEIATLPVFTLAAAAKALSISDECVRACADDGRLEEVVALGGGVRLVTSQSVEKALADPDGIKHKPKRPRGPRYPARMEFIKMHLADGATLQEVATAVGLSRERIRQLINAFVPIEERDRLCAYCGKPLPGETAWARQYHRGCAKKKDSERRRANSKAARYHQRNYLTPTEVIALGEYKARQMSAVWVPGMAPFDFWVNGKRVDVKGANLGSTGRFQFAIIGWRNKAEIARWHYDDLLKRCDLFHCVGVDSDHTYHLMIPAGLLNGIHAVSWRLPGARRRDSKWDEWSDRWDLLE